MILRFGANISYKSSWDILILLGSLASIMKDLFIIDNKLEEDI